MEASEHLSDVGEFGLLARILPRLPQHEQVLVGPGDDAAVLDVGGVRVLACTDVLVEGTHFRRDWSSAHDVGRKAAAVTLADIAAMGGRPTALLAGVTAPADLEPRWLVEMAEGMRDEAAPLGCSVVGGDLVAGPQVSISVAGVGVTDDDPVTRSGASPGDVVAVCGRLGWASAGLAVLQRGFRSPRALVDAHRRPEPVYDAGPEAARLGATALIDVSDGLLADVGHLAEQSHVAIVLDATRVPVDPTLAQMAHGLGADVRDWVFGGGEDHALVGCFPSQTVLPERWVLIGTVRPGEGVSVEGWDESDRPTVAGAGGYQHFGGGTTQPT